jgi:hypothetical protein
LLTVTFVEKLSNYFQHEASADRQWIEVKQFSRGSQRTGELDGLNHCQKLKGDCL